MSGERSGVELGACMLALVVAACGGVANDARQPMAPPAQSSSQLPAPAATEPEEQSTPEASAEHEPVADQPAPSGEESDEYEPTADYNDAYMAVLFDEFCVGCHADAASADWMISQGWLIPRDPRRSPAFQVIALPEGPHADEPWPGEDDVLRICSYVAGRGGFECTAAGLAELRRSLD
jgi:hypothetical protein